MGSEKYLRRRDVLAGLLTLRAVRGTALLMRLSDRRIITVQDGDLARRLVTRPGSTVKPLALLALIEAGKLTGRDEYVCPRRLVINGRSLPCVHPFVPLPMNVSRAIAYSCNCAAAHFAERFAPGELTSALAAAGFTSQTGLLPGGEAAGEVTRGLYGARGQLQALGEDGVRVTPLELLLAVLVISTASETIRMVYARRLPLTASTRKTPLSLTGTGTEAALQRLFAVSG